MTYDLIIVGAGPAGLTASIYASRYKINHLVIGEIPGGLITEAHSVCNFPGEIEISGYDLMEKFKKNADHCGSEIKTMEKIVEIKKEDNLFVLVTESGNSFKAKTILLATGTKNRLLGLEEEKRYIGKGVAYCATCDAMFFKDKIVGVVGGGDSALTAALYLAEVAKKVSLFVRNDHFKGEVAWIDQVNKNEKIEVFFNTKVKSLNGENRLESAVLIREEDEFKMEMDGLFIEIGTEPDNFLSNQLGIENDRGFLKVDQAQRTNIPGVWAAGDLTTNSNFFRQVVTACSEGAIASYDIFSFLQKDK
ncbi:MAG: FAD-dependent oxidoreductase [Patescibacteria group bacterium]